MRIIFYILLFSFVIRSVSFGQDLVTNDGLAITVQSGLTATFKGSFTNQTKGASLGSIANSGIISLTGSWTNNAANSVFSTNTGEVNFNGSAGSQTIGGSNSTTFYDLTFNNTSGTFPEIIFGVGSNVNDKLTMTQGNMSLAGNTITLGNSVSSPGTLVYTNGFIYGGVFNRWFDTTSFVVGNAKGFYPLGTASGDFRPIWLGFDSSLTAGGTVDIIHSPTYPSGANPVNYFDATWGGGTTVEGVSNSNWVISSANGFDINGSTGNLRFGGYGFGLFTLTDLNASLAASAVGTFMPATNVNIPLEVNRLVNTTDLSNVWYIGTKDIAATILPIELLSFTAACDNRNVLIKWSTASETNNDYFTIERSTDFLNWEVVKIIQGAGNSTTLKMYSFLDSNRSEGKYVYYRLMQTDRDGNFKYSGIIAAINCSENISENHFTIYPNPSSGLFTSEFNGNRNEVRSVNVYDNLGQIVYSSGKYEPSIDLSNLKSGNYFIRLNSNENYYTGKILIRR